MNKTVVSLTQIQQLVLDIQRIERNHHIPETGKPENVVEHSYSVSLLCWKLHTALHINLNLEKIFKYCLAHDFLERGLLKDVNTYADPKTREEKKRREELELLKLETEFADFPDMIQAIKDYEEMFDEEAKFVWTVDKIQAIILGEMDDWRPYRKIAVTHQQFVDKGEDILRKCPESLKDTMLEVNQHSRKTFYDQP